MPSNLRLQLDAQSTQSFYPHQISTKTSPKSKMSLTQTYRVASTARGKLGMEAARPDHNLRLLVGHANLLDSLMVELANAEREQEAWFNNTIRNANAAKTESSPRHIQWIDSIAEEADMYDDDSSSDEESDDEDDVVDTRDFAAPPRRRSVSPPPPAREFDDESDEDSDEELDDYDEDVEELALQRVSSRVPDLIHEHDHEDSDSEDEAMPPSPKESVLQFVDTKAAAGIDFSDFASKDLLPATATAPMITAY